MEILTPRQRSQVGERRVEDTSRGSGNTHGEVVWVLQVACTFVRSPIPGFRYSVRDSSGEKISRSDTFLKITCGVLQGS